MHFHMLLQLHFLRLLCSSGSHCNSRNLLHYISAAYRECYLCTWEKNVCPYIQVIREEEFAPVKNANGSNFDTPDSARLLVLRLHSRWVVAAGGFLTHSVPLYLTGKSILYIMRSYSSIEAYKVHSYAKRRETRE